MKKMKNKHKKKYNEKQIERMKSDSIRLAILYRSLFILKYKFEKYKNEVNKVYDKYYGGEKKKLESYDHRVIKTANFFPLVQEIFNEMKITIPKIINPKDIFYFDIVNFDPNDKNHTESIKLMEKIVLNKNNLDKYNKIYYTRKIKPLVDLFLKKKDSDDVTECYKITEYDRKGRVVNSCDKLFEMLGIKGGYKGLRKNPREEYDSYMKKGDILFVDTLPILIADFLQVNPEFVVINLDLNDNELINQIKTLFDNDILKKIKEEEDKNKKIVKKEPEIELTEDQKKLRDLYNKKRKLEETLKLYQDLLSQKKLNGESYKYILDFIDKIKIQIAKLYEEIKELENKINGITEEKKLEDQLNEILPPIKGGATNEIDLRMREIFSFYCSQHRAPASYPTFAQISYKVNHMNISEFCKFCKDFKIPLDIDKLMEIYNKREPINENSEINYNEFLMILYKISVYLNENKKRKLQKKIDKIKKRMEGGNVSSDSDENEEEMEDDGNKLEKKQNELEHLNKLNFKGAYSELQKYLEIDKPKKYRDKMKGFLIRYHDDTEKIEKYESLTKEEIIKVQEKVEKFKKIREENEKEKENIKEKKKKELYEIKKVGFIEQNKRLLKRIKEKEVKKTYMMLKKIKKKEDQKCIINIDKPTEELKINLNNEDKKLLYIDEDEENSDEEILEKYGVPKNKKIIKKEDKKINNNNLNDKINIENKEIKSDINNNNTSINNNNDNNNENNAENTINNKTETNDNISGVNTSNTNSTNDIKVLKQNLKPKKKGNIYFSSNNDINNSIKESEKDKEKENTENIKKEEEEKEEKEEKNEKNEKNNDKIINLKNSYNNNKEKEEKNNNTINKINTIKNNSEDKKEKEKEIKKAEGIYLTEPDINKFRKRTIPAKSSSQNKTSNRKIQIKKRIGSNSLEKRKIINLDLFSKSNKKPEKNKNVSFKKDIMNLNKNINKVNDIIPQNKSYDKISFSTNNIKNMNDRRISNYENNEKNNKNILSNSIKKHKIDNNMPIIQLPSVSLNNISFSPNKQNQNNINMKESKEFKESKESSSNMKSVFTENNVIILPDINSQKSSRNIISNKDNALENKRYLLFQKNFNKDSKFNKSIKFNSNIISLNDEKDKMRNKKNQQQKKNDNNLNKKNNNIYYKK